MLTPFKCKAIACYVAATLCFIITRAQSTWDKTIYNCSANMLQAQFADSDINIIRDVSFAKPNAFNIAPDAFYKDQKCNLTGACTNSGEELRYDIYYPSTHTYYGCPLPVIFIFHGGGFKECSDKNEGASVTFCKEFAKRGFVAVSVEYRRGSNNDPTGKRSASYACAMYRGFQDMRGAIRSFIKMQKDGMFPQFKFNTTAIFAGGAGTVPMNVAYYDQRMLDIVFPGIKDVLGPVNADFYYGDTTINYALKGVMNISGGVIAPLTNTSNFVSPGIKPAPLISFTGALDPVAPYNVGYSYNSDDSFSIESNCLLNSNLVYRVNNYNGNLPDQLVLGGAYLDSFLHASKVPTELYLDCQMGHSYNLQTAFGLGPTTALVLNQYIVGRTASFFQAVVNNYAGKLKTRKFINCVNYRYGCSTADNHQDTNSLTCSKTTPTVSAKTATEIYTYKLAGKNLLLNMATAGKTLIYLYDVNGNLRLSKTSRDNQVNIYTGDLKSGVYMLQVIQGGAKQSNTIFF